MSNDILQHDQLQWPPNRSEFSRILLPWYLTWPLPKYNRFPYSIGDFGDLLMLQLLRPDLPNLPCLFSTFYLQYPSVLSRFSLLKGCGKPAGNVNLPDTWFHPFCICSYCWDLYPPFIVIFSTLPIYISLGVFSILHFTSFCKCILH